MASITIDNVQKAFGKVIAVDQLNLEIKNGEFFTFLGPSGCGKTTTLRMIAGFYYPTKGTVRFNDKDMTRVPPEKRNTGMVFQNYALFPHMTVFENVAFGLKVRKAPSSEIKSRVESILSKVRLHQYADRQVSQLSGGQQQRVALARALVIEPEILLLDEPLSNLDAKLRDEMREEILRLKNEFGITTVYVTHDQAEALSMSDRIAVFNVGVCHQVGTPLEIYNEPANDFVARFIGDINLLPVTVKKADDRYIYAEVPFGPEKKELIVHNDPFNYKPGQTGPLSISIRPEAIKIMTKPEEGTNVFSGHIQHVQFFGSHLNVDISIGGQVLKANVFNNARTTALAEGDPVHVKLPEHLLRIIPNVSGDAP